MDEFTSISLSAPYKQLFDHAALYPPAADGGGGGGIGPVRRHRSMTLSARGPMTSNSGGGGGGGGSGGSSGGSPSPIMSTSLPRGYHPYAYSADNSRTGSTNSRAGSTHSRASSAHSRAGSTHSSPSVHSVPLTGEYGLSRSNSRNSSYSIGGGGNAGTWKSLTMS